MSRQPRLTRSSLASRGGRNWTAHRPASPSTAAAAASATDGVANDDDDHANDDREDIELKVYISDFPSRVVSSRRQKIKHLVTELLNHFKLK